MVHLLKEVSCSRVMEDVYLKFFSPLQMFDNRRLAVVHELYTFSDATKTLRVPVNGAVQP